MSLKRVAVIAYHSSPLLEPGSGDAGGMTVYVRALAKCLSVRGVQTDIFTRASNGDRPVSDLFPGVRVASIEAGPRKPLSKEELLRHIDDFAVGVRAFSTSQRANYDAIHSHYWQSGLAGEKLSAAWSAPLVHSQHTLARVKNSVLAPGEAPEPLSRITGEDRVIGASDVLITSTDDEFVQLSCLYGASHDRLKTIHPGVDHSLFTNGDRTAPRRRLGFGDDDPVLLCVGRVQPLKGLDLAIRAMAELEPALDRKATLLVVGGASGPSGEREMTRLRKLAAGNGLSDHVRFVGPHPHASLPDFYRAADALLVTSHSESFGLAALEAHACGTPVVGAPVGGLSHIVRDGSSGFLIETRDPSAFARRLETLLTDRALWESFSKTAELSAASFHWERTASEMHELYDCLIEERSPQACTC